MERNRDDKPMTVPGMLWQRLRQMFSPHKSQPEYLEIPELADGGRSIFIRHLDCGSCNGCELELNALANPLYDTERFGIEFVASPRHADVLVMTGPFTVNLAEAARLTFEAMPNPRRVITVGDCAKDGGVYRNSYAVTTRPAEIEQAIEINIPGCPPTPEDILKAFAKLPPSPAEP
jgi:Ni,Fe-hydrogenase III small subunit